MAKTYLLFIKLVVVFLQCYTIACLAINTDEQALLAFKAQITFGPYNILANNWSTATSFCNWIGVSCSRRHGRVTALTLPSMGLNGTMAPELGNLSFLATLDLSNNSFKGYIPHELGKLPRLKLINLVANKLSGEIPEELGDLSQLQFLFLGANQLSGSIPSTIFNISSLKRIVLASNHRLSGRLPVDLCEHLPVLEELEISFNNLSGRIPSSLQKCKMLRVLAMDGSNKFTGRIPKELGNLTMLEELYLGFNDLEGEIPAEIGNLRNLQNFAVEHSGLTGTIPPAIFNISSLQDLVVANNSIFGSLPMDLCHRLPNLQILFLFDNKFVGNIPRDIGNCTMLQQLRLGRNNFTGAIPHEMGNLRYLKVVRLPVNSLTGLIPPNIFNSSTIEDITLAVNNFYGNLPANLDLWLPNLKRLILDGNQLDGIIPSSIANSTELIQLELSENLFTGSVPMTFGNLQFLQRLTLIGNFLVNDPSTPELSFLTSLTNCKNLIVLGFSNNPIRGIFPPFVNFSTTLEALDGSNCEIMGMIPRGLGNLSSLISLSLSNNDLTGPIPDTFQNLAKIQRLYLMDNMLQDSIPNSLCHLSNLGELTLSRNRLAGSIPSCFGNLTSLRDLQLDSNNLTSSIPFSLWSLKDLLIFNVSSNSLDGNLPSEIGNLKVMYQLDLSKNQFFGGIPSELGGLQQLTQLSLAHNKFQGPIPGSIGSIVSLEYLDLSNNMLSGVIPKSLEALPYLKYFNVSNNSLEGEIPDGGPFANFTAQSFMNNVGLCGAPQMGFKPCNASSSSKKSTPFLKYVLPATAIAILVLGFVCVLSRQRRQKKKRTDPASTTQPDLLNIATYRRFSYQELMQATNGFDESNLLGKGSWSFVYKGTLADGMVVAVKVFNLQLEGALESFDAECEVLRNIRHRNLVKIISSCANIDFKALVMEFMPNGSLEALLHSNCYCLDMVQRLNIIADVAVAVEYLHHNYSRPVVHCDIKPSNVLLDEHMVAHLGDFGVSKLLGESISMTQTKTLATIGYMAPEYGSQGIVSTRGDIYSFGIMMMEILTRKKPTDKMFEGEMCLKDWVLESLKSGRISEIMDFNLLNTNESDLAAKEQCVSSLMSLALACCEESPEMRINIRDVLQRLRKIKDQFEMSMQSTCKLP